MCGENDKKDLYRCQRLDTKVRENEHQDKSNHTIMISIRGNNDLNQGD